MKTRWFMLAAVVALSAGCATVQGKSTGSLERSQWIAAKLTEAEQLGAKECSPRSLAKARVALEHVKHEVDEGYYTDAWLAPDFAEADKLADELLAERRLAATLGRPFRCVSAMKRRNSAEGGPELLPPREDRLAPWPSSDYGAEAAEPRS